MSRFLHRILVWLAPLCFNILNVLLGGNLPPLGAACVIVEDKGRFLMIMRFDGRVSFPGGFMRWREHPTQTARRECREETGLDVVLHDTIGTYYNISTHPFRMSTINIVFAGTVVDESKMRGSVEGHPAWMTEAEMKKTLNGRFSTILQDYLAYRERTKSRE